MLFLGDGHFPSRQFMKTANMDAQLHAPLIWLSTCGHPRRMAMPKEIFLVDQAQGIVANLTQRNLSQDLDGHHLIRSSKQLSHRKAQSQLIT